VLASFLARLSPCQEGIPSIKILFSDEFKDRLRILAKRYRSIRTDIQPLIDDLQIGKFIGDKIPGIGYTVFKVRLKNSDIQKGKSSGYRVIYQLKDNSYVLMLLIYAKSDQTDIPAQQIQDIINKFDSF
jgi:mRNA-degrading endonuclease RelE of RelBE toxin-antitoxin system